jgi:hypothetical protein
MARIVEHKRCGLVDRHGARVGYGVHNLSCVNGKRGKLLFRGFL